MNSNTLNTKLEAKPIRSLIEMSPAERVLLTGQELRDRHAILAGKPIGRRHSSPFTSKPALIAEILRLEALEVVAPAPAPVASPPAPVASIGFLQTLQGKRLSMEPIKRKNAVQAELSLNCTPSLWEMTADGVQSSGTFSGTPIFRFKHVETVNGKTCFLDRLERGNHNENRVVVYRLIDEMPENPAQKWLCHQVDGGFTLSSLCKPAEFLKIDKHGMAICGKQGENGDVFTFVPPAPLAAPAPVPSPVVAPAPVPSPAPSPEKPKRELNAKLVAMNAERKAIFEQMKKGWADANPSFAGMAKDELKKAVADGKVAKPPSLTDAIMEHSRRMRVLAPLHDQKAQFRRDAKDLLKGELLPAWIAGGKIGREPSLWIAKQELQRRRALSEPKITVISDPEVFDKILEINGNKFALNSLNWVIDGSKEWVGLWDPVKKVIDTTAPAPDSDDE